MIGFQNPTGGAAGGGSIMGSAGSALRYPHPFFDVGQTYMPISVKHLFRWCHLYYQQNGLVNTVINKMAQYPVTKVTLKGESHSHTEIFERLFRDELNLEQFVISCNVDYYAFGNAYISVHLPIIKYLECQHCKHKAPADSVNYKFENFQFKIQKCSSCKKAGNAKVSDLSVPVRDKIRLIRWNPEDIDVIYNDTTGESSYVLKVPENTAKGVRTGNPLFLNTTPQVFIDAVAKSQSVLLSPYNLYHMRRESVAGRDIGYGQPLIMPALKDLYLMQVLKKSQEAIAHEHIVPLRILHPASSGTTDPITSMDLGSWQATMRNELLRWRQDPNYTPIVGLPIGFQYLGGQGKSLLLTNELKQLSEMVVTGMNVPIEFAFGGMSFSGSSVSLRMLENQFQRNQTQNAKLVRFIINTISRFLDVPPCDAEFVSIKTADDIQRKQLLLNLAQSAKISDKTLLSEFNLDYTDEIKQIESEQGTRSRFESKQFIQNAENQGQASVIQAKYQARAQMEMQKGMGGASGGPAEGEGDAGGDGGGQALDEEQVQKVVKQIKSMPENERAGALEQLKQYVDPATLQAITQAVQGAGEDAKGSMKPQPDQKPPRRSAGKASI